MIDKKSVKIGDRVRIQVTGTIGEHGAKVVGFDRRDQQAIVEIYGETEWRGHRLKREDYIITAVDGPALGGE